MRASPAKRAAKSTSRGRWDVAKAVGTGQAVERPWGLALALKTFGTLGGALLVSNNTATGNSNGYNLKTGKLKGTVKNAAGKAIAINGL